MSSHHQNASLTSSEKKRLRDRRAQQTMREKRDARVKALEDRAAFCDQHHAAGWVQQLFNAVYSLRQENEMLRARQEHLSSIVTSWKMADEVTVQPPMSRSSSTTDGGSGAPFHHSSSTHIKLPPPSTTTTISEAFPTTNNNSHARHSPHPELSPPSGTGAVEPPPILNPISHHSHSSDSSSPHGFFSSAPTPLPETIHLPGLLSPCPPLQAISTTVPPWCLLPMNSSTPEIFVPPTCPWLSPADLVSSTPPHPSPLDLLHGTRRNYLADGIHRAIRRRAMRDSECLALGWLAYLYSRWRMAPSPATFARLTDFQRPVLAQLQTPHPMALDFMVWPQMRRNLMRHWAKYDFVELTGYMSCCVKVRWPWGKNVLERDEEDRLQVRREFLEVFTDEGGWGVTEEFIERYPELVEGMDVEALRFRITVPSEEDFAREGL
ncbi:hypothetical protein FE257_007831 [Aspergillus nanangensis]|uniref:BZIP domain-containing protein n=1 Tax=Aspergillus nanangensis TaxID=2582783 RepID=A0AAD4H045_ASPNN|nr:hypothetical protein FE257_007831 [Aspergillus nanangensis]